MDATVGINVIKTNLTVPANGTLYGVPIDLSTFLGYFSFQGILTGSGTLTVAYQLSNSDKAPQTWSTPVGASSIAAGLTAGTYMYKVVPYTIAKWMRLSFTETGTSDAVTIVSNMAGQ